MTRLQFALLSALLPTALAFPQYANKPSGGYLTGAPYATGGPKISYGATAPYGQQNSTVAGATGTGTGLIGTGPTAVPISSITVTVLPLPMHTATDETSTGSSSLGDNSINSPNANFDQSGTESSNSISNPGGTESSNSLSKENDSCGPATVIVTSRNTVTVTVGVLASSQLPVHVLSSLSSSSFTVPLADSAYTLSIGAGTVSVKKSTGVLPASSTLVHKHGYHHKKLHHKSRSSALPSSTSAAVPGTPLVSDTTATTVTTPEASFTSSTSVLESTTPEALIASSIPVPETSTPVAYKALVHSSSEDKSSILPITPQAFSAAPSPIVTPSSSTSLETSSTLAVYKAPTSSSSKASSKIPLVTPQVYSAAPSPNEAPTSSASLEASSSSIDQSSASASTAAKPAASTPSSSFSGAKRGLVYNSAALTQSFSSSSAISWCYNWDSQPGGDVPSNFNFVPMMWGPIEVHTSNWKTNADSAIAKGSTHLLGFNEPDLPAQANLTPQEAADSWKTYMEPYAGKAKLGSPAVCNGGGLTGLNWLDSFFNACSGCTIDFVPIHWYGLANDAGVADFKDHTAKAIAAAKGKPVWITEFKPDGSPEEMTSFMTQILPFLDSTEGVERYSWFEVDGILVNGGSLTALGSQYAA